MHRSAQPSLFLFFSSSSSFFFGGGVEGWDSGPGPEVSPRSLNRSSEKRRARTDLCWRACPSQNGKKEEKKRVKNRGLDVGCLEKPGVAT